MWNGLKHTTVNNDSHTTVYNNRVCCFCVGCCGAVVVIGVVEPGYAGCVYRHPTEFGAGQVVRIPPGAAQNLGLSVKCRFFSTDVGDNLATPRYNEASIRVLKGLEPVRQRPGMYTRTENPLHVVQEVIDLSLIHI